MRRLTPGVTVVMWLVLDVALSAAQEKASGWMFVRSATPSLLEVMAGRGEQVVHIKGTGLHKVNKAAVIADGDTVAHVSARILRGCTPDSLRVAIQAGRNARSADGLQLRLIGKLRALDIPERILAISVEPALEPVGLSRPEMAVSVGQELWMGPSDISCPAEGEVRTVIDITGRGIGDPSQPDKTEVLFFAGQNQQRIQGELLSVDPTRARVKVPRGAVKGHLSVSNPGGQDLSRDPFRPLYILHFSPGIFGPSGALSVLHMYDCQIVLAYGEDNSMFWVPNQMRDLGFEIRYLSCEPYTQIIDLALVKTTFRVRLTGTDRTDRNTCMVSTSFDVQFDGPKLVIKTEFESLGHECVGEYETQDLLTGEIHWHRFMYLDIDNMWFQAEFPLEGAFYRKIQIGDVSVTLNFDAVFSIFDSPGFDVSETFIKDFMYNDFVSKLTGMFNAEGFKDMLASYLTDHVNNSVNFSECPVWSYDLRTASDGGMDIIATTPYD